MLEGKQHQYMYVMGKKFNICTKFYYISWCSGYHICLTHRRSPVRSRAETYFPFCPEGRSDEFKQTLKVIFAVITIEH
jgi:hypothetical protein